MQNHGLAASKAWFLKVEKNSRGDCPWSASLPPDADCSPYITWKRAHQHTADASGISSRAVSAETTAAEWANAEESAKHWEQAFKETIHPTLTRTLPSVNEFRIQVRGGVDQLWKGMDVDMQNGMPLGGKTYSDWMTGDKQNLSWHNTQRAAEMRFRTRDLDDESSDAGDSNDQDGVSDDLRPAPDAGEGAKQEGAVEKPTQQDTQTIIHALISMDVAEPLAAEAVEATGGQGVAQALKWILEEREGDPRLGASWRFGDSRPSTAGTLWQSCAVPASPLPHQASQGQSRPGTGASTQRYATMHLEARPQTLRPGTAVTTHSVGAASKYSNDSRPKTAILKRTISQGYDGLAASRPKPPSTPRLHSAFAGPNPNKITTMCDASHYTRCTEEYKKLRLVAGGSDHAPLSSVSQKVRSRSPETSQLSQLSVSKAWAPVATKQIIKLQGREGLTTPLECIPDDALANRPLPPDPNAIKEWYQERMHLLETRKQEHLSKGRGPNCAPHIKVHTLRSDEINQKLAANYDPVQSSGYFLIEKLAEKSTEALIKGFTEIDPKRKGYVSRHELESLFRAWEIPIGPTSLQQILDRICPCSSISTSYPPTERVDYRKLVQTLTGRPFRPVHAGQATANHVQAHAVNANSAHSAAQAIARTHPTHRENNDPQDTLFVTQRSQSLESELPKMPVQEENAGTTGSIMHGEERVAAPIPHAPHTPRTPRTPRPLHSTERFSASRRSHALTNTASVRPTTAPQVRQHQTLPGTLAGMESPRAPRVLAAPGGAGKMSRAIAHAIMARRFILGLQEQVMSEMNPLMTNTMSTHARKLHDQHHVNTCAQAP
jgi:hypothetical protein